MPATHPELYPLLFQPIFQNYLWGGERLSRQLGKSTGPGSWAESWEIVDHQKAQSQVSNGPLAGKSLNELISCYKENLLGDVVWKQMNETHLPDQLKGHFPLLIKFLDASQTLSVQVHPNDQQGAQLTPPDLGKSEAWYVVDCQPESMIYAGLKSNVSRNQFESAIIRGETATCLHSFAAKSGDCIYIPAGTQHAIGAGLLILEVQQASDTTFRVFDWNRLGPTGQPRELHIEAALEVTDFKRGPIQPQVPRPLAGGGELLVESPFFRIRRWRTGDHFVLGSSDRCELIVVVHGEIRIEGQGFGVAKTILLPCSTSGFEFEMGSDSTILQIEVPDRTIE